MKVSNTFVFGSGTVGIPGTAAVATLAVGPDTLPLPPDPTNGNVLPAEEPLEIT